MKRETISARFQRIEESKYQAYLAYGRRAYQKLKEDPERYQKRLEQVRNRRHQIEKDVQSYRQPMSKEEEKPKAAEEDKATYKPLGVGEATSTGEKQTIGCRIRRYHTGE